MLIGIVAATLLVSKYFIFYPFMSQPNKSNNLYRFTFPHNNSKQYNRSIYNSFIVFGKYSGDIDNYHSASYQFIQHDIFTQM